MEYYQRQSPQHFISKQTAILQMFDCNVRQIPSRLLVYDMKVIIKNMRMRFRSVFKTLLKLAIVKLSVRMRLKPFSKKFE